MKYKRRGMTQMSVDQGFQWARQQHMAGRLADAEGIYRQILAHSPAHAFSLHYLGVIALQIGRIDEAIPLMRRALAIDANVSDFHHNFGLALQESGRLDEAANEFRAALAIAPRNAPSMSSLATVLTTQGKVDAAIDLFHQALALSPDDGMTYNNCGTAEMSRGHFAAAERALRRAGELLPAVSEVHANLGNLSLWSGRIGDAIASYRRAIQLTPDSHIAWSNLLMALHYHPALTPAEILREHQPWVDRLAAPLTKAAPALANDRSPDRKLRIAYVTTDFREHPIAYFMEPVLRNHDRSRFEIFAYCDVGVSDAVTDKLRGMVDHRRETRPSDSDETIAQRIRDDRIDILVDLAAHTAYNRLLVFARRAAPVQISYLAYAGTTGLPAMDYRVTDAIIDPPGGEEFSTEKLLRLPRLFCAYAPPVNAPDVAPCPAAANGFVTFGALCTLAKVNDAVIDLWARVLAAVPRSRLIMRARGIDGEMQEDLRGKFQQRGIAGERLELLNQAALADYLATFGRIDIELDPFPYSAHTTTCHALWMGAAVITLIGQTGVSRVSASVLTAAGLPELIARDADQYVNIALALADVPRLARMRAGLRERLSASSLLDGAGLTRALEAVYRSAWEQWARSTPPALMR